MNTLVLLLALFAVVTAGIVLLGRRLRGEDLRRFDAPRPPSVNAGRAVSAGQRQVERMLRDHAAVLRGRGGIPAIRAAMEGSMLEALGDAMRPALDTEFLPVEIDVAGGGTVPAEWVLTPGVDPARRLLYVHGGGFVAGSPRSHRTLTERLSRRLGMAVLAIDYRLRPEHSRVDGIEDCRSAYDWIIDHGPQGAAPAQTLWVAGDSAGGNLTLMLTAWARDTGRRPADGAIALSPATNETLVEDSLRSNAESDLFLTGFGQLLKRLPITPVLLATLFRYRRSPAEPCFSPVQGDLSGLPPTLLLASTKEMLLDQSVRYANKAAAAGSPVNLALWDGMEHVWPLFAPVLSEGEEALDHIEAFVRDVTVGIGPARAVPLAAG